MRSGSSVVEGGETERQADRGRHRQTEREGESL